MVVAMRVDPAWMARRARIGKPGTPSPEAVTWVRRLLTPLTRLAHRPKLVGADKLPPGPFLLVANHSSVGTSEVFALIVTWMAQFGTARPLTAMAHPFAFVVWPLTIFMRHMGAIPSTYAAAEKALGEGIPVLVFPGGDWEASRPFWYANQVQFNGRKGFLRIARKMGVPIVPLGIRGSIYTAPMVWRARWLSWVLVLPRLLGVRVFPVSLLGVLGVAAVWIFGQPLGVAWMIGLSWAWIACPLSLLPWIPATIRLKIGDPIPHRVLFPESTANDEQLEDAYERVVAAVQSLIV